jgi:sugar phosphate isomerase/epimerase
MFIISAFADEIGPEPQLQVDVLKSCGVRHIEFRSILSKNVLDLSDLQINEYKSLLDKHGFKLSAIGSPIGKIRIDQPFEPHLQRFRRALELCKVFGTSNIRIFSYYKPEQGGWNDAWRKEVFHRMETKIKMAEQAGVRLLHENEHNIYGDDPDRVVDLLKNFTSPGFGAIFDPANYEHGGFCVWKGWKLTRDRTVHFHIKDWIWNEPIASLPGEGHGLIPEVMADAVKLNFHGFATMEPHLLAGGPTGGHTGPELFPKAVRAYTAILDKVGAKYQ